MRIASSHDVDLKRIARDAAEHLAALWPKARPDGPDEAPGDDPAVVGVVDDCYSEAVNFRFEMQGVTHRGLVTYDALKIRHGDAGHEPEMALFLQHAQEICASAAQKVSRGEAEPVVLETEDL
jgi:hypothetical protein